MLPFMSLNNYSGCWMNLSGYRWHSGLGGEKGCFLVWVFFSSFFPFFFFLFLRGDCLASVYEYKYSDITQILCSFWES